MATTPKPKSATAKTAGKPRAGKTPKPEAESVEPQAEASGAAPKANAALKLKVLIDRVTEASGAKRQDVKPVVEATLIQLGEALARGEAMNLPGFGHLRVSRKATAETPSMTLKLRQSEPGKGKSAKAEPEDDDS